MWDIYDVTRITYQADYRYMTTFDDGLCHEIDFAHYLDRGPVFFPLKKKEFFRQVRIIGGIMAWPNSADVSPESLYAQIRSQS